MRYQINKIKMIQILFVFSILMWNCNVNETQEQTDEYPDDIVKSAVYSGPKYPSDFYQENFYDAVLNYIQQWDTPTSTEPATDNYNTALDLTHIRLNELGLDRSKLIDGQSTEKYFEFNWASDSLITHPEYYFRVHKSSYFEGVKLGTLDENKFQIVELGKINYRPFSIQFVQDFFDRLWFYKHYNFGGAVVLKRTVLENQNNYNYTIYYTRTTFGDYGLQDKIKVYKGYFDLNKVNGICQINYSFIKEVRGN